MVYLLCVLSIGLTGCGSSGKSKFEPAASSYEQKFFSLSDGSMEMRVKGAAITSSFFDGSNQEALLGRLFVKEEFNRNARRVALMSKGFWVNHFKSDPSIIGKSVSIDGADYTVVGILPDSFNAPAGAELWIPKF